MKNHLFTLLSLLVFLGCRPELATAQLYEIDTYTRSVQAKGYWTLKTDPILRTTRIEFYNEDNELYYQELLSNQYIKLSKRNIRRFDTMLEQLVGHQLVASQLKTDVLPVFVPNAKAKVDLTKHTSLSSALQANIRISKEGKLKVSFMNPQKRPVLLQLLDQNDQILYQNKIAEEKHNQNLNLTQLSFGEYQLRLISDNQKLTYPISINLRSHYHVIPSQLDKFTEKRTATDSLLITTSM
ncbi:hypothetical protein GO755_19235 [Spirosoma sp. HMF4905]|uniref:Uncharacterized protein n=1 Tax=Spirosoma arboris TaxID=2682092 RepID=A0A7K1SEF8_9BACT|nr:hypothetical protein [Spirosoma arboris]MVM32190.1 hypothetical protein [Spirosoma arboris]